VQKWPDGQPPRIFLKFSFIKNKQIGAIWEVFDTIDHIEKNWNFREVDYKN
jgi:hypothetical protein